MRRTLTLAAAAAVAALTMTVAPAAHADQTFSGTFTASDQVTAILEPDDAHEKCSFDGSESAVAVVDTVTLTADIAGNRRFVVSPTSGSPGLLVIYVYRNGACVGADYTPDPGDAANAIDVDKVAFAAGDRITVKIATNYEGFASFGWKLLVQQPEPVKGAAKAAATGKGTRFASLPGAISCAKHTVAVKFTKKAVKNVKKAVIKANGKQLKKVTSFKRKPVTLKHLPAAATDVSVVLTLKSGKKVSVQRSYWGC
jgi:hypothetical protein